MFKVVRTTGILPFHPSLPACTSQVVFTTPTPQIPACKQLRSSRAHAQLLSACPAPWLSLSVLLQARSWLPVPHRQLPHSSSDLCRITDGQTPALPDQGAGHGCVLALGEQGCCSSEQSEPHSLRLLPLAASAVFIAGFNKAAGFAERHFSWRCFPSRVGGWQRLAKSGDLSLVCLLRPEREARSETLAELCPSRGRQRDKPFSRCHGHTCACTCGCAQAFHKGCKCTQLTASLENTCFSPQSQLLFLAGTVSAAKSARLGGATPLSDPKAGTQMLSHPGTQTQAPT